MVFGLFGKKHAHYAEVRPIVLQQYLEKFLLLRGPRLGFVLAVQASRTGERFAVTGLFLTLFGFLVKRHSYSELDLVYKGGNSDGGVFMGGGLLLFHKIK